MVKVQKFVLSLLIIITLIGLGELTYKQLANTTYLGDMMMKEEFWKNRNSFEATIDSPLIPIQLPGPLDSWAGGVSKEITFESPYSQSSLITVKFLDSHESSPTQIAAIVDGNVLSTYTVKAGAGKTHPLWRNQGIGSSITIDLPVSYLKKGGAKVTLRYLAGSWSAIDKVVIKPMCPT